MFDHIRFTSKYIALFVAACESSAAKIHCVITSVGVLLVEIFVALNKEDLFEGSVFIIFTNNQTFVLNQNDARIVFAFLSVVEKQGLLPLIGAFLY
jgi:hypothetical protein